MNTSSWRKILSLKQREVISIVGAGGKTTLMFTLAKQLSRSGFNVISTTTTKIFYPSPQETSIIIRGQNWKHKLQFHKNKHITIINDILPQNKVRGFPVKVIDQWAKLPQVNYIIVEADGARRCPLKWPDIKKEPVTPQSTTTTIAVVGGDSFCKCLKEENVFRAQLFAQKSNTKLGERITLQAISRLFLDKEGLFVHSPPHAKKLFLLTK